MGQGKASYTEQVNAHVTPEQKAKVIAESKRTGENESQVVRTLINKLPEPK